ncbi:6555_t:CDS:2 [Entrophospora sp. SA101]|nr:6555_t:CDS:2 [Entrophospora sp. SA101]
MTDLDDLRDKKWICSSNKALKLRFEQIYGYKNLAIKMYYASGSLATYFDVSYDKQIQGVGSKSIADEFIVNIKKYIPDDFITNYDVFIQTVQSDAYSFKPMGEKICEYNIDDEDDTSYEIYMYEWFNSASSRIPVASNKKYIDGKRLPFKNIPLFFDRYFFNHKLPKCQSWFLFDACEFNLLTSIAQKISGLPKHQVFGSGTFLDSARLRLKLSSLLKVSETAIHCYVLGEHGDSQIIAWTSAHVGGKPLLDYQEIKDLKDEEREQIEKEIANKAYEIINLKGATYFGIAGCVSMLVQSITLNQRQIRPLTLDNDEDEINENYIDSRY